jgi:hypothetical protein
VIGEAEYSKQLWNLPPKLDREILKQLATEQLVEMIIEEGNSIEKLTNRIE